MEGVESTVPATPGRVPEGQSLTIPAGVQFQVESSSATNSFEEVLQLVEEKKTGTTNVPSPALQAHELGTEPAQASSPVQLLGADSPEKPPAKAPSATPQPEQPEIPALDQQLRPESIHAADPAGENDTDVTRSPSDGSSPIRPMVRKSSLNFASLPAREPLTSNKSLGTRMSRTSHFDQARTSYYPRATGGKSLGVRQDGVDGDADAMDVDEDEDGASDDAEEETQTVFATHNKTYTQRLQDQISMLGKSQTSGTRPSKSIPSLAGTQQSYVSAPPQTSQPARPAQEEISRSPSRLLQTIRTPGAFPEDDEDDWIAPPTTKQISRESPRPGIGKSNSADVMEDLRGKSTISGVDFGLREVESQEALPKSPHRSPRKPPPSTHQNASSLGHGKSISVPELLHESQSTASSEQHTLRKVVSISKPMMEESQTIEMTEAPKSPSKSFRESPLKQNALKQVKNSFSSILKGSRNLLASSAAISAEGKASLVNSPTTTRLQRQNTKSAESLAPEKEFQKQEEPLYPDLTKHMQPEPDHALSPSPLSPSASNGRRTRASTERDRREQKQKDKEEREVQHLAEQMAKLERAREREREKARVFSLEQDEKMAAEKQSATQKEQDKLTRTPAPKVAMKTTRTSPRKAQTQVGSEGDGAEDDINAGVAEQYMETAEPPANKPAPPSIPRPTPGQTLKAREIKRPLKPTRDAAVRPKQAPTLIRVNTSSQHGGFHPSNNVLAANLQESFGSSQQQPKAKTSQSSMHTKSSSQNLKSSVNSTIGRPKALDLAEKRRQEEEKKAQRKRDFKAEIERKREEDRREEEERREKERQRAAAEEEAKRAAARQAAIERAKQTKAPPPAVRSQTHGASGSVSRPPSRLGQSTTHRSQEDMSRPFKTVLSSSTAKMPMKRPLQQDNMDDAGQRPTGARTRPSQQKEVKRLRMSDEFDPEEEMEIQSYGTNIKGPPVRPSTGFKKVSCIASFVFLLEGVMLTGLAGRTKQVSILERIRTRPSGRHTGHFQSTGRVTPQQKRTSSRHGTGLQGSYTVRIQPAWRRTLSQDTGSASWSHGRQVSCQVSNKIVAPLPERRAH